MAYKEFQPSGLFENHIDTFWISENSTSKKQETRILPDGFVDIIFEINNSTKLISANNIRVSGMMTKARNVVSSPATEVIGVRFKPGSFMPISNIPITELKNATASANDIDLGINTAIIEQLAEMDSAELKIGLVEAIFKDRFVWSNDKVDPIISSVCNVISGSFKTLNLVQIASDHCISLRQLERRFKAAVGVTMKEYHSVVRFNKTVASIEKSPNSSLLHIAFDNGYFDHAHLTKDFHRIAGINPSEL